MSSQWKRRCEKPVIGSGRSQLVEKLIYRSPCVGTQLLSGGHQGEVVMDPADDHAATQTKRAHNSLSIVCVCVCVRKMDQGLQNFCLRSARREIEWDLASVSVCAPTYNWVIYPPPLALS